MASLDVIPYDIFDQSETVVIYFFIGRLNPPHEGHEGALKKLIHMAGEEHSIPLILLGSGPNKGEKTLDDPLTFLTKKKVLKYRLVDQLCEIREKTNPITDVMDWTKEVIRNMSVQPTEVIYKLVVGNKNDNATKLDWVHKTLVKETEKLGLISSSLTIPIDAIESKGIKMSATKVRQDALKHTEEEFVQMYGEFYGPHTVNVHGEITNIAEEVGTKVVAHYIDTGEIYKPPKGSKKKKGNAINKGASEPTGNAKHKPKTKRTVKVKTPSP